MRILITTDAWYPQVNGVVRTLDTVATELRRRGHAVTLVTPDRFRTVPCPTYPEIHLAMAPGRNIRSLFGSFHPDAVHIATEGPIGLAARRICLARRMPFSTSFHTKFPEYVHARFRIPTAWTYRWLRRFHAAARHTMVATESVRAELAARGFGNLVMWSRGVDTALFYPRPKASGTASRPIHLYVGRVAVEKNIEAFLALDLAGTKRVVGDGPQLEQLRRRYPEVEFLGTRHGEALAAAYADADVFVFPSLTDTFGLVLLEALASGVPVAAFPVTGPIDVINGHPVGCLDEDLARAARRAIDIAPETCRAFALARSWEKSADQFLANLAPVRSTGEVAIHPA
jgi:glycosyltransferase involved in cell wall biosynthesis